MPSRYISNPQDPSLGRKQARVVAITQALGLPDIHWDKHLRTKLRDLGWNHVNPYLDKRGRGRSAMAKGCYLPRGCMTVVFTRHGPMLHTPDAPLPDTSREKCVEYYTQDLEESAERYWNRVIAEQNSRYGWDWNSWVRSEQDAH